MHGAVADGLCWIVHGDGSVRFTRAASARERWRLCLPDGRILRALPQGCLDVLAADGTVVSKDAAGLWRAVRPDGQQHERTSEGPWTAVGRVLRVEAATDVVSQTRVVTREDGVALVTRRDGTRTAVFPDGSRITTSAGSAGPEYLLEGAAVIPVRCSPVGPVTILTFPDATELVCVRGSTAPHTAYVRRSDGVEVVAEHGVAVTVRAGSAAWRVPWSGGAVEPADDAVQDPLSLDSPEPRVFAVAPDGSGLELLSGPSLPPASTAVPHDAVLSVVITQPVAAPAPAEDVSVLWAAPRPLSRVPPLAHASAIPAALVSAQGTTTRADTDRDAPTVWCRSFVRQLDASNAASGATTLPLTSASDVLLSDTDLLTRWATSPAACLPPLLPVCLPAVHVG